MARTTKVITLSLPPEMVEKAEKLMKKEGRTRSELFREALRRYFEEQEWKDILKYGKEKSREKDITADQVENIVDSYRK